MDIKGKHIKCVSNFQAPELVVGKVYTASEVRTNTHGIWQVEVGGKWYAQNRFEIAKEKEEMKQQFYVGDVVKLNQLGIEAGSRVVQGDIDCDLWNSKYLLMLKQQRTATVSEPASLQVWLEDNAFFVIPEHLEVVERAWQKNTGQQPVEDDVEVEVKLRCAAEDKCLAGEFNWDFEDCSGIVEWRLADSMQSTEEQPEDSVPPSHVAVGDELVSVPASVKVWCDTCEGTGEIDETVGGLPRQYARHDAPCPDRDGKGWWEKIMPEISSADVAEQMDKKHSHYFKKCGYDYVDVYRVLKMFCVTDPCISHAAKKLLVSGGRGFKDIEHDIQDVIDTLVRWQEMRKEDEDAQS